MARVTGATDCWTWSGAVTRKGYGRLSVDGRNIYAHRLSYELHRGPVPDGMLVCHHCDNPPCVNPEHLFVGTAKDNHADAVAKGRMDRPDGTMPRGNQHWCAKLSEADVLAIRKGADNHSATARRFGVSERTVRDIRAGRTWKHLEVPSD